MSAICKECGQRLPDRPLIKPYAIMSQPIPGMIAGAPRLNLVIQKEDKGVSLEIYDEPTQTRLTFCLNTDAASEFMRKFDALRAHESPKDTP